MTDPRADELLHLDDTGGDNPRWAEVEARLGIALPRVFKSMASQFGDYHWNEFAFILNPLDPPYFSRIEGLLEAERELRQHFPDESIFPLHPETGGLLPWAATDNGHALFFLTRSPDELWPTVIKGARGPDLSVHFMPCNLILRLIARGEWGAFL